MAFDKTNFIFSSELSNVAPRLHSYASSADAVATIKASGYFNTITDNLIKYDVIFIQGSDANLMVEISSATGAATVTVVDYTDPAGGITLAQGNVLVGNASGVAAALDASTDTQVLVGNGTTITSVAMSGDATMANTGAVTIAAGAVDEAMINPNTLTGTVAANVADANVIGGLPQLFRIDTAGGATANTDVTVTHKIRVLDAWIVNKAAGTASDTITITDGSTAISDAVDISGADKTIARIGTIDDSVAEIAAAGTLRVTETDGGGSDSPATSVYVLAVRVA